MSNEAQIDLDSMNAVADVAPKQAEHVEVVFVAFVDTEVRINQTTKKIAKGRPTKVSRDEARILLEANKGYIKD